MVPASILSQNFCDIRACERAFMLAKFDFGELIDVGLYRPNDIGVAPSCLCLNALKKKKKQESKNNDPKATLLKFFFLINVHLSSYLLTMFYIAAQPILNVFSCL